MEIKIPYYEDLSRISNSNIGLFIKKGPKYLKDTLDGKNESMKAKYLEKGTMIHMYLLQPDEFWQTYEILDFETPSSKQQLLFAQTYVNSCEIEPNSRVLSAYQEAYSTKGKSDDKSLTEGLELVEKLKDYIQYLQIEKTTVKKVISWADLNMLKDIKVNVEKHKLANELLFNQPDTVEQHNEFHINWEYPIQFSDITIQCKSLLDRVIFDDVNKVITLIDIKTTVDVNGFKHSISEFDYNRQLAYYWAAIHWYYFYIKGITLEEYTYKTYIIAIQNNTGNEVKVFEINPVDIEERVPTITNILQKISWHMKNDKWDHTEEYYLGDGSEKI